MSCLLLFIAGLLEVVWASILPTTSGLTRPLPSIVFLTALAGSMYLLSRAVQVIPSAPLTWLGSASSSRCGGHRRHNDPVTLVRLGFLALLAVAIVGVKLTSQ